MQQITKQDVSKLFKLMEITEIEPAQAGERAGISPRAWQYWRDGQRVPTYMFYWRMFDAVIELARERRDERRRWADELAGKVAELGVEL